MAKYDIVLLDLDGTISASAEGIRYSIEKTIEETGCKTFDTSDYTLYIGPPLMDTFNNHCGLKGEKAEQAVEVYRRIYDTKGKFINKVYDGIKPALKSLKGAGVKVAVATSKYEKFAQEIVDYLGLKSYIDRVCGSKLDGTRKDKKDIIPYAVEALGGKMTDKILMIGDTYFDAKGARLCGVDFLGVTYGYGNVEAMRAEGAVDFVNNPLEIANYAL